MGPTHVPGGLAELPGLLSNGPRAGCFAGACGVLAMERLWEVARQLDPKNGADL